MANLATYGANALLDGTALPATLYVQLHTGDPSAAGTANVATETTRKSFTRTAASAGVASNVLLLEWLAYPAVETLSHITVWDAASAGNCWFVDAITTPPETVIGQAAEIAVGELSFTLPIWS